MEQVFEGTPKAVLALSGRAVTRTDVSYDWGSRMRWKVSRDGQVVATPHAPRTGMTYEHPDATPGKYEIVLQMFKYVNYKKDKAGGEYTESPYVDISDAVTYTI
jgi:hypothetical protein